MRITEDMAPGPADQAGAVANWASSEDHSVHPHDAAVRGVVQADWRAAAGRVLLVLWLLRQR